MAIRGEGLIEAALAHYDEAQAIRKSLTNDSRHLVGGRFTYADIAIACALQFFAPVTDHFIRPGSATRTAWTHAAITARHAGLIAWRDLLYTERRLTG